MSSIRSRRTDSIVVTGLRVRANHGVFDFERADGQEFVVDVTAWLDLSAAAAGDDLGATVHYGELAEAVAARNAFELAGLSPIVTTTGSLVAALALLEGAADAATVWRAAEVDEDWQAEQWGEDDLARRARDAHRADFDAGARFLSLL